MHEHHDHASHDDASHAHASHSHGGVTHGAPAEWRAAYTSAYDAAEPRPGREVVTVELEAAETDWEFVPGRTTRAWTFNGRVPGPTIEARVGDVLEVRLTNRLAEPTAIHWHGLRVPAAMDGTDMVQRPVAPGETFTYRFVLPDAGTFWYHPHVNEVVQLERGLYGALVVREDDGLQFDAERVLVLDDVALDRHGQVKPPGWWIEQHNGREGSTRLINGRQEPTLTVAAGQVERWRVVNASSARYVVLSIGGRPFTVIGTDGGLIDAPMTMNELLLTPADRAELVVGPFAEGETMTIEALRYNRRAVKLVHDEPFGTLRVGAPAPSRATPLPARLREIEPLAPADAAPMRECHLSEKPTLTHGVDFLINNEKHHRDQPVEVNSLQVWDVVNDSDMDHPFHLHGFFFQVLSVNGEPPAFRSWEDTVNVPPKSRVRIAWRADDRTGEWMYHCHILEHHAAGMMAHFAVVRPGEQRAEHGSHMHGHGHG